MRPPIRASRCALGLTLLLAALARGGEDEELTNLARELVQKRTEVERLASQLELDKAAQREALRSAAQQRADLERQVKALEQELEQVAQASAGQAAAVESRQAARAALTPLVARHLTALEAQVRGGLPFRTAERAGELARLRGELLAGRLAAPEAIGRLWSSYEDELRLCRENALHREQVEIDGRSQLVDVVRVGMVLGYFRGLDGRYGLIAPSEQGWRWSLVEDRATRQQIAALFEAQDKHIRQGFFLLPNPWSGPAAGPDRSDR